jgi:hypothetical protein
MVLKCTQENVHDKVPNVWAGDVTLSYTSAREEKGSVCSESTGVVKEASIFAFFPNG